MRKHADFSVCTDEQALNCVKPATSRSPPSKPYPMPLAVTWMGGSGYGSRTSCAWVTRCAASRQPWAGTRPPSSGNWTGTATLTATTCHTRPIMTPECNGAGRKCTSLLATGGCAPWCNAN